MMADLNEIDEQLCATSRWDFSGLRALFVNCTLKRSPEISHTQALGDRSIAIMQRNGVTVDTIRAVDHSIATGVHPDMTEYGWEHDDWPAIHERVMAADILVLLSPIWLGEKSSVCTRVIERLYGNSHLLTRTGSTPTTAGSAAASSPATARMLKDAGGIPAHGNQRAAWDAGCRFDFVNPDYR
jgi:multimeric flavodoxin WrbA